MNRKCSFLLSKFNVAEVQICEFYRYFINWCYLHVNFKENFRTELIFSDHSRIEWTFDITSGTKTPPPPPDPEY